MSDFWQIVLGAFLAIVGGAANNELSEWRSRCRERKAVSISISDELTEIIQLLEKIKTVWEATHTLIPSYIKDLKTCTGAYDGLRQRLFLVKNEELRKDITTFYRNLKSAVNSDMRKAGSLSRSEDAQKEQSEIATKFINFISQADKIKSKLK